MSKEKNPAKASYHRPIFSTYGNLTELTKATNTGTEPDNALAPNNQSRKNQ